MWPLTVVPPLCREAWVVSMADKYCSLLETLHVRKGTADQEATFEEKGSGKRREEGMLDGLYEKLNAYALTDFYPFHMPGHKRNPETGPLAPFYRFGYYRD